MPWQQNVGKTKKHEPILIDAERIDKFARGIAEDNRRHTDPTHESFCAPPLIVATAVIPGTGMMLSEVDLELNFARIVHGSIDIDFHEPVRAGDSVACTAKFDGVEEKSSGSLINFDFEVHNQSEALVCRGTTRYFVRGEKKGGKSNGTSDGGQPVLSFTQVVPDGQSLLYAEGSGDVFPIHTSKKFAQSVGLPDVILHGMCTLAFAVRGIVAELLDSDSSKLTSVGVRFSKMVFSADELTTHVYRDGHDSFHFVTDNQHGKRVLTDGRVTIAP